MAGLLGRERGAGKKNLAHRRRVASWTDRNGEVVKKKPQQNID